MDLLKTKQQAIEIAQAAGEILREGFYQEKTIDRKSSTVDLVTEYDRRAEAYIVEQLQTAFPDHRLVGEEGANVTGDGRSPYVWYIDPIDGTTNFTHGIPFVSVSMALYAQDTPLVGVVYNPIIDECFTAAAGFGAYVTTSRGETPIRVSNAPTLRQSLIATGFPYDRLESDLDNAVETAAFIKQVRGLRRLGSAALDLAYVAAGRLDGYWEYKTKIWDIAAGVLLIQEAGGRVSKIVDHAPFKPEASNAIVASNRLIHQEMFTVLDRVRSA